MDLTGGIKILKTWNLRHLKLNALLEAMHNFEIYSCFFIKQHKLHLLDLHTDGEFCNCWYIKYTLWNTDMCVLHFSINVTVLNFHYYSLDYNY